MLYIHKSINVQYFGFAMELLRLVVVVAELLKLSSLKVPKASNFAKSLLSLKFKGDLFSFELVELLVLSLVRFAVLKKSSSKLLSLKASNKAVDTCCVLLVTFKLSPKASNAVVVLLITLPKASNASKDVRDFVFVFKGFELESKLLLEVVSKLSLNASKKGSVFKTFVFLLDSIVEVDDFVENVSKSAKLSNRLVVVAFALFAFIGMGVLLLDFAEPSFISEPLAPINADDVDDNELSIPDLPSDATITSSLKTFSGSVGNSSSSSSKGSLILNGSS
ncbi:hypothetical protein FF38_11524 [Lucilia cuprina]|uniref:Uncharacterized protein n=1 Tax=Lucilia cuprina TaxID=7375 RepID=A0A0L0CBE2_LUCCU|nr:hypothetical protein FF38_11524 [Lucilia cuprina]